MYNVWTNEQTAEWDKMLVLQITGITFRLSISVTNRNKLDMVALWEDLWLDTFDCLVDLKTYIILFLQRVVTINTNNIAYT